MSAPSWERDEFAEGGGYWLRYRTRSGWEFCIDVSDGVFQAIYVPAHQGCDDRSIGPVRKTLKAALNDCRRESKKLRAEHVQFGRAKP
jgi:hypothetical protein